MRKGILLIVSAFFFLSCQTAELHRLEAENQSLQQELTQRIGEESEARSLWMEAVERITVLSKELADSKEQRDEILRNRENLQIEFDLLQRKFSTLEADNIHLLDLLEKLQDFMQMMKSSSIKEKPNDEASRLESRSRLIQRPSAGGRVEFFDANLSSLEGISLFLTIEEERGRSAFLFLNLQHSYWIVRKDVRILEARITVGDRVFPVSYTEADVQFQDRNGIRTERFRLPVQGKTEDMLKEILKGERNIRVQFALPDFTRERILTQKERQALGNMIYAFQEMGGTLF